MISQKIFQMKLQADMILVIILEKMKMNVTELWLMKLMKSLIIKNLGVHLE